MFDESKVSKLFAHQIPSGFFLQRRECVSPECGLAVLAGDPFWLVFFGKYDEAAVGAWTEPQLGVALEEKWGKDSNASKFAKVTSFTLNYFLSFDAFGNGLSMFLNCGWIQKLFQENTHNFFFFMALHY